MAKRPPLQKPDNLSRDQWIASLHSDRRVLLAQLRREVHTRGNTVQSQINRIDDALAAASEGTRT